MSDDERGGRPSSSHFDSYFRCLGQLELCKKVPADQGSAASKRGQKIHEVLEHRPDGLQMEDLCESDQITCSRIMHEEARLVEEFHFEGGEVIRERRLWMIDDDFNPLWSGRCDVTHISADRKRGMILDYKSGFSATVPAPKNYQIKSLVCLAHEHHPYVESWRGGLIHPHHPDSLSETLLFTAKAIDEVTNEINQFVAEIEKPNQPRTPNSVSCTYCPARTLCPEYQAQLKSLIPLDGSKLVKPKWTTMSSKELGSLLKTAKMASKVIEEIQEFAKQQLEDNPNSVDGWALRPSGSVRTITSQPEAKKLVLETWGPEVLEDCTEISLKMAEERIGEKFKANKDLSKEMVENVLKPVLTFKPKKKALIEK